MENIDIVKTVPLNIKCPVCYKNELNLTYTTSHIPYFGDILIISIKCKNCGFKISDIMAITYEKQQALERKITSETLSDLLVLSANSTVTIPEVGIELDIRTEMGGQITTIEGLLLELQEYAKQLLETQIDEENREKISEIIKKLETERSNPSGSLTVKIIDETGKSAIVSHKLWARKTEEEREKAKRIDEKNIENLAEEVLKKYSKENQ
ncbi:MAG: ZPR1 zinc finger domain-containing protein [Candidatus Njordarchaeia archaeon]